MKHLPLFLLCGLLATPSLFAQPRTYSTYYDQRASLFEVLPAAPDDLVFLGNSITDGCEWSELFDNGRVKNRGISGDVVMGVYDRLGPILKGNPSKIFLLIGINDLAVGIPADTIVRQIGLIVERVKTESPRTRLYIQSLLPVNDCYDMFRGHTSRWQAVAEINRELQTLSQEKGVTYIDLYAHFVEEGSGKLRPEYSNDGLHLLGAGYLKWRDILKPYLED